MAQDAAGEVKRRGRPREFDAVVSVRLPKQLHDELSREALRRREDLADVMRERLSVSQNQQRQRTALDYQ